MTDDGEDLRTRATALVLESAFIFALDFDEDGGYSGKIHVTCG